MTGEPLSAKQVEQMFALLAQLSGRYFRTGVTDIQTLDWNVVDSRVQEILSPGQLITFQTVEPEDGSNLYTFRFGSRVGSLTNQAKRSAAALPPVSLPPIGKTTK